MRPSVISAALSSAVAVTGLGVPLHRRPPVEVRDMHARANDSLDALTFQLIPLDQAKSDAEKNGVFQPEPDHDTADQAYAGTSGKGVANVDADVAGGDTCTDPAIRYEWRDLTDAHKVEFINAVKCLIGKPSAGSEYPGSQNRYEDLASVHQQMTGTIHMVGQFLPWHRYFLSIYESLLRDECGLTGPMPWWDETKDAGNFTVSPLFTDAYFGPIPTKGSDGSSSCLATGSFARTLHIGPGGSQTDHCLARGLDDSLTAQCSTDFTNYCNSYTAYSDMEKCAEGGPHAYCHNGIGGVMADVASSVGDPVFFMHHGFIDHNWRIWQNADAARLTEIGGATASDGTGTLTLDYVLTSRGLSPNVTVRDVMNTMGGHFCYRYNY